MASTITGLQIAEAVVRRGGLGIYMPAADWAVAATTITSLKWLANGFHSTNEYRDRETVVYRPGSTSPPADTIRWAGDLAPTTGVITVATMADTTLGTEPCILLDHNLHPQWLVDAINRAMTRAYFDNLEPLSLAADAGFQATGTTAYTASGTTFTKVTTADSFDVFTGIGSGRTATADGYITQTFNVHPDEQIYVGALARANAGTASLVLQDETGAAAMNSGNVRSHSGENWAYLWRQENVIPGCETMGVRLTVSGTGDVNWNGLWVYRVRDNFVKLDTKWDTAFKVPALAYMTFGAAVSSSNHVEAAFSRNLREVPRTAYDFQMEKPGANPFAIQFHEEGWLNHPLYIQGRRAYSDLTTFTIALSETTACDLDLIESLTRVELFSDFAVQQRLPAVDKRLAAAEEAVQMASKQFVTEGPAERRPVQVRQRALN